MGKKGAKLTSDAEEAAGAFVARVAEVGDVSSKKMFGGLGVFVDGVMFGIVDSTGAIYLRRGPPNDALFEAAESQRHGRMPYYSIPGDVLRDDSTVVTWARLAAKAAHEAKKQ